MIVDVGRIKQETEYTVSVAVDQKNREPAFVSVGWQPILEMELHPYSYQMNLEPGRAGAHTQKCPLASEYCSIEILVELTKDETRAAELGEVTLTISGLADQTWPAQLSITRNGLYCLEIIPS
jgi:hypothetical protein